MSPPVAASPEQIAKVLEVLQLSVPRGAFIKQIRDQTGYTTEIIWSAIHALEQEGKIVGRDPFTYDLGAVNTDPDDSEK